MRFSMKTEFYDMATKFKKLGKEGQMILDEQALKDSNFYAPEDQEYLISSSIRNTNPGDGKLIWDTEYARRLYYNPQYNFSKDKNPNARGLWFEEAKSNFKRDWTKAIQKAIERFM